MATYNMEMSVEENALAATLELIQKLRAKAPSPKRDAKLAAAIAERDLLATKVRANRSACGS